MRGPAAGRGRSGQLLRGQRRRYEGSGELGDDGAGAGGGVAECGAGRRFGPSALPSDGSCSRSTSPRSQRRRRRACAGGANLSGSADPAKVRAIDVAGRPAGPPIGPGPGWRWSCRTPTCAGRGRGLTLDTNEGDRASEDDFVEWAASRLRVGGDGRVEVFTPPPRPLGEVGVLALRRAPPAGPAPSPSRARQAPRHRDACRRRRNRAARSPRSDCAGGTRRSASATAQSRTPRPELAESVLEISGVIRREVTIAAPRPGSIVRSSSAGIAFP